MTGKFTNEARKAIDYAVRAASYHRQGYAGTEHLLTGLLKATQSAASSLLADAGVDPERLSRMIDDLVAPEGGIALDEKPGFSPRCTAVLQGAAELADMLGSDEAGTEHILLVMLRDTECVATRLLHSMGVDIRKLFADTLAVMNTDGSLNAEDLMNGKFLKGAAPETTTLNKYSRDLTKLAAQGRLDPVIGRDREILRVMEIISRRTKNNPCLIGEPGVGKTAVVEGLAQRMAAGDVPDSMQGKKLVMLDLSGMVAGTKYRGEFEERIKNVIREVAENKNILLFIDELHTIIGAGGAEGALDASNILKPALSRGDIQIIGATTIDEYRKHIEKDTALERRFQPVTVEEPTEEEAIGILKGLRPYYEKHHGVTITDEALTAAVRLSERYINDRRLPDKAIDLIDESASRVRIGDYGRKHGQKDVQKESDRDDENEKLAMLKTAKEDAVLLGNFDQAKVLQDEQSALEQKLEKRHVRRRRSGSHALVETEETVAETVADWTGIPVAKLAETESKRLMHLEKELHKRVIGQEEAIRAVSGAIRRGRVGLKDPNRPTGSFLFLGPTGVGKTELSKAVAETVFGSEQNMIRVDMSEYMEKYSVSKLIGSPPGYVGYEEGGQLSEQVRRHPYSVILFDEIEKAHPDVFNILLQVLDEGHITDAHGHRVDFKNTCIIMTSNAGAKSIMEPKHLGFGAGDNEQKDYESMKSGVMEEVKRIFKPEFLNRIDEIIVFHPLKQEEVGEIAALMFGTLKKRAKDQMNITLKLTPAAKKYIAEKGFSPKFGARPLKRVIQSEIENPLSEMILRGEVREGGGVTVFVKDGKISLAPVSEPAEGKEAK